MNSDDTIRKFDNIVKLRRAITYNPLIHSIKWYACIKCLDGKRYGSRSALKPAYYNLTICAN